MRPSLLPLLLQFTTKLEGRVPWMYLDREGLVTTGIGNLIDSPSAAVALPWKHGFGGPPASPTEIIDAWHKVKNATQFESEGGGSQDFAHITDLRLDPEDIDSLVAAKLESNEKDIIAQFPGFQTWPSYAQAGMHSMSWARGSRGYHQEYPKFSAALNSIVPNFNVAANESNMKGIGIDERNAENKIMFQNAAKIVAAKGDYDQFSLPILPLDKVMNAVATINKIGFFALALGGAGYGLFRYFQK